MIGRSSCVYVCTALLVTTAHAVADEELRQCTNETCGRYALSETWTFCPYCGTKLPQVTATAGGKGHVVLGNVYKNHDQQFQVERPNRNWTIASDPDEVKEFNSDATVAMQSPDEVYCIVIAEKAANVPLSDYVNLITPQLENRVKVSERSVQEDDQDRVYLKWSGTYNNIPFHFYQMVVDGGMWKYQITSWCLAANDTAGTKKEIEAIQASFRTLDKN